MLKYAKIVDEKNKICDVALGNNIEFYKQIGMSLIDVEQDSNGTWYVSGFKPKKQQKTIEEKLIELESSNDMPRIIREIILANPTIYSEYVVNKAKELEDLAIQLRSKK